MTTTTSRMALGALALSATAFVAMLQREGYSDQAIIPTKGDVPTIGFGSTDGVRLGDKTTPVQAVARALADSQKFEGALKRCVRVPLHQREYDAYTLLSYNIGSGAFCASTLVKRLNVQDYAGACQQILAWKMFQGTDCSKPNKICGGIWADRLRLHAMCTGADQPAATAVATAAGG